MTNVPDTDSSVVAVMRAWTVPGPHPHFHAAAQDRLRRTWPVLANALDALTRDATEHPRSGCCEAFDQQHGGRP
jgi:hypothetical protein